MRMIYLLLVILFFSSCSINQPIKSQSATILIKTNSMKFYDNGFIKKFPNYTNVQIYSAGQVVLDLSLYDNQICQSTFKCLDIKTFNQEYLNLNSSDNILKKIFDDNKEVVRYRDKKSNILIKINKK